jgi:ABC-type branched-subunit amino acid transport system ATPase component
MGVGYVPEERAVFSLLTVKENLNIAIKRGGTGKWDIHEKLMAVIKRIKSEETTILLVEQNVASTLDIADHLFVLEEGRIVFHTNRKDFKKEEKVLNNYLRV